MAIKNNSTIGGVTESAAYSYDNLGRLVTSDQTSNGSSAQRRFAYDRWGNRTKMWDAASGGNRIQLITQQQSGGVPTNQIATVNNNGVVVNYVYDAAGNVTNDGVHTYQYDAENRLMNVDGGATASYTYDHQNRRYKKATGSLLTNYVCQGSQVLAEHDGSSGVVLIDYNYSGSRMIAKVARGTTQYFLSDRLSVRLVLDASGNVIARQSHLPFGEDFAESGLHEKRHLTSYERDAESQLDYAVNRYYGASTARFTTVDPITDILRVTAPGGCEGVSYDDYVGEALRKPQNSNRFSYVASDPINETDPLGLIFFKCVYGCLRSAGVSVYGSLVCGGACRVNPAACAICGGATLFLVELCSVLCAHTILRD